MKIKQKKRLGFALIEVCISVIIVSIIFIIVLNIFRSSLAHSQKGMNQLANMETAVIIMANLEYDLTRAKNLLDYSNGTGFELRLIDEESNKKQESWVNYKVDNAKGTILRNMRLPREVTSRLGKDLKTNMEYTFFKMPSSKVKYGLDITLKVYGKNRENDKDAFTLRRFIMCRSMTTSLVKDAFSNNNSFDADVGIGGLVHPGIIE